MARIAGVDLPASKRLDIGLTYIYGIGRTNVKKIIETTGLSAAKRIKDLTDEEIGKLAKVVEKNFTTEGDLRQEVRENIKRLMEIRAYRGIRHERKLPVRGQRTRSNARTKRGKRLTIGAMKKDDRTKLDTKTAAPAATK